MQLSLSYLDGVLSLYFAGELDHHSAKEAMTKIGHAVDVNLPHRCVVDFSGLSFMDSSGIAVVLNIYKRMRELGGEAELLHVQPQPMKVLRAAGVYRVIEIA